MMRPCQAARVAEIQNKLGPQSKVSLMELVKIHARPFESAFETLERLILCEALVHCDGYQIDAARELRTTQQVICYDLKRYGLTREHPAAAARRKTA